MKFPLDNKNRRTAGAKTAVIHDATGRIVISVHRVNLPKEHDESVSAWRAREIQATVDRASAIVRTLNSCYTLVQSMGRHQEQQWLPGIDRPDDDEEGQ